MSFNDCVDGLWSEGQLSDKLRDKAKEKFNEYAEDIRGRYSDWERKAAQKVEQDLETARIRRKRARAIQAIKQGEVLAELATAPVGRKFRAAEAKLEFDNQGKFNFVNVTTMHDSMRRTAFGIMADFLDRFRSKNGGLSRETTGLMDVVRALHGQEAPPQAKAFAESVMKAREYLRMRHNKAGGAIQTRKDWGWVQSHNRELMASVTKEQWKEFVRPRLDVSRMYDAAGGPMTARRLDQFLDEMYDDMVTGGLDTSVRGGGDEFISPITRRIHHRELVFQNADLWMEYQEKFGSGNILSSIVGEIDRLSRDTALIEVLGPYPKAMLEVMKRAVDEDYGRLAAEKTGREANRASSKQGKHRKLDTMYDIVSGEANLPAHQGWAMANQTFRNLITSARLGSSVFVSLGDVATTTLTSYMNGIPQARLIRELVGQLTPGGRANRRMAARANMIADTWTGDLVAAQRIMGEVSGAAKSARIADTALRLGGLSAWTDGVRTSFKLAFVGHLSDEASKAWSRVHPTMRKAMQKYGISEADWELYRSTPIWTDPETRAEFIRPEDVYREFETVSGLPPGERDARFNTAQKFNNMISSEAMFAVVAPTARARAVTLAGTAPGTLGGELLRNFMLFKSFMASYTIMHGSRMMAQEGAWNKAAYLGWVTIGMTLAGAIAEQTSSIARGKEPREMDEKFWASAVARGGSFGPLGDFLYADVNRFGHGLVEAMAGPVAGSLSDLWKAGPANIQELITTGEAKNWPREVRRFVEGLTPGNSLWYTRAAFDRMVKDQLELLADPDITSKYRRAETRAKREFNQGYWWRQGEFVPE